MERERREIASLTKIMTCYVVLSLVKTFGLDDRSHFIEVTENAASMQGTSAELRMGDHLCVWDLLHGLMLPSGNDAAYALAEYFGQMLIDAKEQEMIRAEEELRMQQTENGKNGQANGIPLSNSSAINKRRNIFISRNT